MTACTIGWDEAKPDGSPLKEMGLARLARLDTIRIDKLRALS